MPSTKKGTRKTPARGAKKVAKEEEEEVVEVVAAEDTTAPEPEEVVDDVPPALPPVEDTDMNDVEDDAKPAADGDEGNADKEGGKAEGDDSLVDPLTTNGQDFSGGQESWNAMLYQLILFKSKNGDFNVTPDEPVNRALFNWVQTQRRHYELYMDNKTSSTFLNADRIAVLDAIDFQWNIRGENFWQKHFDALVAYKREYGDVRVPRHYGKNSKLGEWVTDQRRQYKAKIEGKPTMLTEERKAQLDELGFIWKVRDRADWNDRYEQLLEFKKENGHCIVPQHYVRNRALGKWVAKQREQYRFFREGRHSFLTEERIDLLKSINFTWQIKGRNKRDLNPNLAESSAPVVAEPKAKAAKTDDSILKDASDAVLINTSEKAKAPSTADAEKVESKGPPALPQIPSQMAGMTAADAINPVNAALQQQLLLQQHRMGGMAGIGNFNLAMAAGAVPGRHFGTGFGNSQLAQIAAMNQQQQQQNNSENGSGEKFNTTSI